MSIFVNPAQFDDPADLATYPRPLETDLDTLETEGADFVFLPRAPDLYADNYRYRVTESGLSTVMEGAYRPGHFDGVLTVVFKLLQIISAERAYFGEKDWQQLTLVRGMVEAFFLSTTIVACGTVRETDGLAVSSRNGRLLLADRTRASRFLPRPVGRPDREGGGSRSAGVGLCRGLRRRPGRAPTGSRPPR